MCWFADVLHILDINYQRSVQFTRSVVSNSLPPHGLEHVRHPKHVRLLCLSATLRACSNSCLSSRWYHPTISSSVFSFSSCLQSFPASGSFPVSQFFTSGGQSIGVSALASVLPMNIQDWFPLGLTGLISFSPRDSEEFSSIPRFKSINYSTLSFLYSSTRTSIHDSWKNHSFDWTEFVGNVSAF